MFVRTIKNKNGKTYVQVVDKSSGKYKVLTSVGSSSDIEQIKKLELKGKQFIEQQTGVQQFDFSNEIGLYKSILSSINTHKLVGIDLLLGKIFDEIGFNKIKDPIFKQLVLYRLVYPSSKLKTTEYLQRYQQINWDENKVYRYLDKLYDTHKTLVQQIS